MIVPPVTEIEFVLQKCYYLEKKTPSALGRCEVIHARTQALTFERGGVIIAKKMKYFTSSITITS